MSNSNEKYDAVVIGAGAAGMMCAIQAGKRGKKVCVIEHNASVGRKIRISGGGRCNFTNIHTKADHYISSNPHFVKSALAQYTPTDFQELVDEYNVAYHEKKLGQLFCDGSSQQIIDLLISECKKYNVKIFLNCSVTAIEHSSNFTLTSKKRIIHCTNLVVATGGLSISKLGATDFGYIIAKQFGIKVNPTRPGLVPIIVNDDIQTLCATLSGVSIDTIVAYQKHRFRENILFTHKGLSGPAILQISSYCLNGQVITIDLLPDSSIKGLIAQNTHSKISLMNFLKNFFPKRFAEIFCNQFLPNKTLSSLSANEIEQINQFIHSWKIPIKDTQGFDKAEVTVGGVDTKELSSKTLESNKVKGLYFIGEVVDVTGHLGGFNFQWAWASGFAAGTHL